LQESNRGHRDTYTNRGQHFPFSQHEQEILRGPQFIWYLLDKSVRVSGNMTLNQNAISESEHRPRPPVTATQIPSRPRPSPSPTKLGQTPLVTSPVKQFDMMDSLNPLVTNGVTAPQNTPERKQMVIYK
jgi:hypothetical protein